MKQYSLSLIIVAFTALASALEEDATRTGNKQLRSLDHLHDTPFRSDTTLRFMSRLRGKENPASDALRDAGRGPNYKSKSAQKASKKVIKKQPKPANPVSEAGEDISDGLQDAGRGPNYSSKSAQDATAKALDKQADTKPANDANPLQEAAEDVQDNMNDALQDAGRGPNYKSKEAQKAAGKVAKEQENSDSQSEDAFPDADDIAESLKKGMQQAGAGPNYDSAAAEDRKGRKDEEDKAVPSEAVPSEPDCVNSPKAWKDSKGNDCEDYSEGEWCNRHGGYGDAWLDEWGTFEDRAGSSGKTAKDACCVCGGGSRSTKENEESSNAAPSPAEGGAPVPAIAGPILGTKLGRKLQEQGYSGELVEHEDENTMTSDWGREFGPNAYDNGHRSIKEICQEHPGNEWCSLHGYFNERSSASCTSLVVVVIGAALGFLQ